MQGSTGSIGIVTINMPKLGFLHKTLDELLEHLDQILERVKIALLMKNEWVEKHYGMGLMPLTRHYQVDFDHYFRTIGILGLHELCINMTGEPIWENVDLIGSILDHLRDWTRQTQLETGKLWNLEMTPGEGCSTRFAMVDRTIHPGIFTQGTAAAPYYSTLMTPANVEMGLGERIRAEAPLLKRFTGGTVFRVYMGEMHPSPEGMWKIITNISKNTDIPYFDLSATFGICTRCNAYNAGPSDTCHTCGGPTKVYQRITGYYRPIGNANVGKVQEFSERKYINLT